MNKRVDYFTEDKLKELAEQPNTIVMKPTYDTLFEPWPAGRVLEIMDTIVKITKNHSNPHEECLKNKNIAEFSSKYQKMYEKLVNVEFVRDDENLKVMKQMILLKAAVDKNMTSEEDAKAEVADLALKSLVSRVKKNESKS